MEAQQGLRIIFAADYVKKDIIVLMQVLQASKFLVALLQYTVLLDHLHLQSYQKDTIVSLALPLLEQVKLFASQDFTATKESSISARQGLMEARMDCLDSFPTTLAYLKLYALDCAHRAIIALRRLHLIKKYRAQYVNKPIYSKP